MGVLKKSLLAAVLAWAACAAPSTQRLRTSESNAPSAPADTPAAQASGSGPSVTVVFVGDMRLDGPVAAVAKEKGWGAPAAKVRSALKADLLFGNLECALTERGEKTEKTWNFRAPPENIAVLKALGFDAVSLANNHVMDYGPQGLEDTLAAVAGAGIAAVGAGKDAAAARKHAVFERNGLRIGLLALTSTQPESMWAGAAKPGVAFSNLAKLPDWIRAAKADCDLLIVSFHGGTELAPEANAVQKAFFTAAFEAGADAVIGHHPHVLQPVLKRDKGFGVYSVGNFLMVSPTPGTEWTVITRLTLSRAGISADFFPLRIGAGVLIPGDETAFNEARLRLDAEGALAAEPERFRLLEVP